MLIRYYGHVGVPSGYGDAASEMCMAILGAGFDLEISTDGDACHKRYLPLARCFRNEEELRTPDVVIVHTLPLDCGAFLERGRLRERYPRAVFVAYTTWEGASPLPRYIWRSLGAFDHVWVPSTATAHCMQSPASLEDRVRTVVVPHPFDEARWLGNGHYTDNLQSPYRFYYLGAWNSRKNVEGVVRAYLRAFTREDDVDLTIQSAQAAPGACQIAQLATGVDPDDMPPIHFSHSRVTDERLQIIHLASHCFVTAARGESWNLPAFDALLARRHIIAPGGLGSDDFLAETSADRYGSRLAPAVGDVRLVDAPDAPPGHAIAQYVATQGLTVRSDWRDPDLGELAIRMRAAYTQRVTNLHIDYDPAERFGRAAVGRRITEILQGAAL